MDSRATVASDFTFGANILSGKRNKVLKGRGKKCQLSLQGPCEGLS